VKVPGAVARGVRAAAGVVVDKACANVRGEADVEVWLEIGSLENVDESLVFRHARRKATETGNRKQWRILLIDPPPPLRGYGATSFACHKLAWFTEPKLAEGERRMVDQNSASWNRVVLWMRQLKSLSSLMTSGFAQGLVRVSQ
jgi:hypothetical protein